MELVCYRKNPVWDRNSVPALLLQRHNTKEGTWGKLRVLAGRLKFYELDEIDLVQEEVILDKDSGPWTIYPQMWHKIELLDEDTRFQLEFHCRPEDLAAKQG